MIAYKERDLFAIKGIIFESVQSIRAKDGHAADTGRRSSEWNKNYNKIGG